MRVSAKADYALRAMAQLAAEQPGAPVKADRIAEQQDIPIRFLLAIMVELKHGRLVRSARGAAGGYMLSRKPGEITLAEILRVVEGPLVDLHDARVRELSYVGAARALTDVWMAVRSNVRSVLEAVTLEDVISGELPTHVRSLADAYRDDERAQNSSGRTPAATIRR